jgi:hypothetical protein
MISTVYVGIPFGSGAVEPWLITMSDLVHLSPHILSGSNLSSVAAQLVLHKKTNSISIPFSSNQTSNQKLKLSHK